MAAALGGALGHDLPASAGGGGGGDLGTRHPTLDAAALPAQAAGSLAGDGKRIRGANRLAGEGLHWETVTLDAGHASYATQAALVQQHGAHYVIGIQGNAPATLARLQGLDWRGAQRTSQPWRKAHGRWEWRKLEALDLEALGPEAGRLLTLHRGHWRVDHSNHYSRDKTFGEDASRLRTGHAPANNAAPNNLALAIVVLRREPGETVPETLTRLTTRRERALEVILRPD